MDSDFGVYPRPPPRIWGDSSETQSDLSPADYPHLRYDPQEIRKRKPGLILRSKLLSCARFTDNVDRPESPFAIELRLIDGDLFHKEVVNNKLMVDFHLTEYHSGAFRGMAALEKLDLDYIGWECLTGMVFKYMIKNRTSYFLHILLLEDSKTYFMSDRRDTHFEIKTLASQTDEQNDDRFYRQAYSFRFPVLGCVKMCCKLFYIVRQDEDEPIIYVRGAIDGVYKDAERLVKGDLGNGIRIQHPTAFALRACEYADERNSVIVGEYVEQLIDLEEQLNDDHLAGHTSFELNNLSRKLGEVADVLARKELEWQHSIEDSQKTIAILTMFFLPATFFAILFTLPLFNWDTPDEPVVRPKIWIYWAFTGASTVGIFALYFLWSPVKKEILKPFTRSKNRDVENQVKKNV
ncbi:hypothetical protein L207DRAFT_591976 [Hyaloscypha variabilis F]|uniref:Cora-domain-containing protein n=1 Tax=Hyaloscypha variabilis (strain UAMH 11265 / GT02V1 / F) TaxID=1149755 RepID=A0A2J6QXP7_HYAVF|nr:hypothetical protein L207DRAFT_591976 [Hyaloscypha variabilis F]